MDTLFFKLITTPLLIGAVTLIGRRLGPAISGVLVGLPLTSGPVVLFLALDHGTAFAAATATGIIAGVMSPAVFCLVYAWLTSRLPWWGALLAGWAAYLVMTALLLGVANAPALPLAFVSVAVLLITLRLMPRARFTLVSATAPAWDIPARMIVATAFVLALTEAATYLGPHLSGLLAPFPLFASILAAFSHRLQGAAAAVRLLRGLVLGMFSFVAFFVVIALLIGPYGILVAFLAAIATAFVLQAIFLTLTRRTERIDSAISLYAGAPE